MSTFRPSDSRTYRNRTAAARHVLLPAGARWVDFFRMGTVYAGGTTIKSYDARDPQRLPLFSREGAIVPLEVRDSSTDLGDSDAANAQSILLFPGPQPSTFVLYDVDEKPTQIAAQAMARSLEITVSRAPRTLFLMVRLDGMPASASFNDGDLPMLGSRAALAGQRAGYTFDATRSLLIAKLPPASAPQKLSITLL